MLSDLRKPEHGAQLLRFAIGKANDCFGAQLLRCALGAEKNRESLGRQVQRHAGYYAVLIQTLLT